jgi:hypothetical protein
MSLTGFKQVYKQEVNANSSNKTEKLGTIGISRFGDFYRYAANGAVALTAGKTVNAIAKVTNHTTITVQAAAAVGATSVNITLGATAATADQYIDGTLVVKDVAGTGTSYAIVGNTATSSAGVITVFLAEPIVIALTTSSIVSLVYSPWNGVLVAPAAAAEVVVGVPQLTVTASTATVTQYAWLKTKGMASVLSDGVISKGAGAIQSASVIGAATIEAAATVTQRLGYAPEATVDTKYDPLFLTID